MLVGCGKLRYRSTSAWVGHEKRAKLLVFFTEFGVRNFETFWNFQKSLRWPKKTLKSSKNYSYLISPFDETTQKHVFLPRKGPYLPNRPNRKRAWDWDAGTRRVCVYREQFNIDFWSQFLFLTSQHVYRESPPPKKKRKSKMRRIVKFCPRGSPYGKSGHGTPEYYGWLISGWKKPTLKPPVVEILIFTEKTQIFQINDNLVLWNMGILVAKRMVVVSQFSSQHWFPYRLSFSLKMELNINSVADFCRAFGRLILA